MPQTSASTRCSSAPRSTGSTPRLTRGIGSARSRISACARNGQRDCNSTVRAPPRASLAGNARSAVVSYRVQRRTLLEQHATQRARRRRLQRAIARCRRSRSSSGLRASSHVAVALRPAQHDLRSAARPALQLSRRLLQNAARRRFRNSGGALQLQRNQRIRIDRRGHVIGVETRDPQRIEVHARAGGAVDHRDCSAGRFGLERRVAQQVAQASERLLQIHAPGHRIERAELGQHAVKFFERLVLDAAQRAIARPAGRAATARESARPSCWRDRCPGHARRRSRRAPRPAAAAQSVSAAQRSISNQFQRSRCSSRNRRSASARAIARLARRR